MADFSIDDLVRYTPKSPDTSEEMFLDGEVCKITNRWYGGYTPDSGYTLISYEIEALGVTVFADPDELEIVFTV